MLLSTNNSKSQCTNKPELGLSVKNYGKGVLNVLMGGRGDKTKREL